MTSWPPCVGLGRGDGEQDDSLGGLCMVHCQVLSSALSSGEERGGEEGGERREERADT